MCIISTTGPECQNSAIWYLLLSDGPRMVEKRRNYVSLLWNALINAIHFFRFIFLLMFLFCTDCNPFIGCDGLRGRPFNTHELVALVILHTLMDSIRQGVSACSHHFCWHHGSAGCGAKACRCFDPGRTTWSPVDLKELPWQCCSPNCLARSLKLFLSSACFQVSEAHKLALVSLTRL